MKVEILIFKINMQMLAPDDDEPRWQPLGLDLEGEDLERYLEVVELRRTLCSDPRRSVTWQGGKPRQGSIPKDKMPDYATIIEKAEEQQRINDRRKRLKKSKKFAL